MESSNSNSKERELQLMQQLVIQRHSYCMTWLEQLEIHLRDLYLDNSSHALRLQLKRKNLHQVNAETCLEALQTQFKEFFASKGVNSSDHLNQCWQKDFEEYTLCKPKIYRRGSLKNLDILEMAIRRAVITYDLLRMKENEVNELKETEKPLNEAIPHEHEIEKSFQLQSKDVQINPVQVVDANSVVTKKGKVDMESSGTKSDEQDTSSRSRNDVDTEDAVIRPVNDQVPLVEVQLTTPHNVLANEQHDYVQSEPSYDTHLLEKVDSNTTPDSTNMCHRVGEIDQNAEKCQVSCPLPDPSFDNMTTEFSNQSLDKTVENADLKAQIQEKVFANAALKNELRKLKGKSLVDDAVTTRSIDPVKPKIDIEPITPKLLNKRTAHSAYIKHTQEEAVVLRDLVEHVKANYPKDLALESACRYTTLIQDLLTHISKTCPSINNFGEQLVAVTPKNKDKKVRFTELLTSLEHTKIDSSSNIVSNKPMLYSTRVRHPTSASGSQPSGNTRNNKILQPPSSNLKNKVEAHPRNVKSSLNKKNDIVKLNGSASVQYFKKNGNSDSVCIKRDDCMSSDNHNLCVSKSMNDMKSRIKSKPIKKMSKRNVWKPTGKVFTKIGYIWRPTGQTFTLVGNVCPLTRITTTTEVPSRKPTVLETETPKPVNLYLLTQRNPVNPEDPQIPMLHLLLLMIASCPNCTVKFGNDHVVKIMGYGDYQIGNVTISRVYYVEEGVDLLTGSRGDNIFTLSLGDMMASSPICLLSTASQMKSWLWHRRLSHLNFGTINHLARHGLVRGLPKLKFEKDHLCSACALGKSTKKPHKPKSKDTNQEKLYLLHMDLCGPMCVASVNGKKYILVIVDDYSRFTWVKCLRSKDEALAFIINFFKMIQVRLKETVRRIRTDNRTEFVNQTLCEYYEKLTVMASEHSSSGPALQDMTPTTISSGLVPNPQSSTSFVPPSRDDWDLLFQPIIEHYIQLQDYTLWEIIEEGNSCKPKPRTNTNEDGTSTTTIPGAVSAEERMKKKNDRRARSILMMALPKARFGGNEATKKTQKTLLKQMYENFTTSSTESLDSIFNRLQKIISQLAILGETRSQEDLNLKFLRSLPNEWNTHVVVWRNKTNLENMSLIDLYNNFKIIEQEVKRSVTSSSNSGSQNLAFVSAHGSTNDGNPTYICVNTAGFLVNTSNTPDNTASLSDATAYAFIASQSKGSQIVHQDLEQIHEDDLELMDLK
ncbi:retrovirus-related pol polyprotein from transposon TNT 1-94 [Tanacetum coccineum]